MEADQGPTDNCAMNSMDLIKKFLQQNFTTEPNPTTTTVPLEYESSTQSLPQAFDSGNEPVVKKPKKRVMKTLAKFLTTETEADNNKKPSPPTEVEPEEKKAEEVEADNPETKDGGEAELSFNEIQEEEEDAKSPGSNGKPDSLLKSSEGRKSSRLGLSVNKKKDTRTSWSPPANPYRPVINPISEELAKRKSSGKKGKTIWDHLYNLDRELKEKRDQCYLEKKLQEEEECLKGCTFQPEIKGPNYVISEINYKQEGDIYERTKQWKQTLDENRIKKKKDHYEQEEEKSCVFKPELSSKLESLPSKEIKEIKGVNKFIERQKIASEARKEKEMYQRRDIGANWVRKTTVPSEFNFATSIDKTKRKEWKKDVDSPLKKKTETPKARNKEVIPTEDQVDFDKARKELHNCIQGLHI